MLRKIWRWYYFHRYGVCPIHLCLCREGGGYEPKWICGQCDSENRTKHAHRALVKEQKRLKVLAKLSKLETYNAR